MLPKYIHCPIERFTQLFSIYLVWPVALLSYGLLAGSLPGLANLTK
jgi:hypothetical protein